MNESPVVMEWKAKARREGKAEAVICVLQCRASPVPDDLAGRIRACTDDAQFDRWLDIAARASTIDQFRQDAGL
jgi:hypothetical protein